MKVLFICNKSPYPAREGGPIAMNMFIEGLIQNGHQIKVIAINSEKYGVNTNEIPEEYKQKTNIETVFIDLQIKFFEAIKCLITNKSYHIHRFISQNFKQKIESILKQETFDIIQLESIFVAPYIGTIRKLSDARIILRTHNVEYKIWEDISKNTKNPAKKSYILHLAKTLKNFELSILPKVDGIVCISKKDKEFFKSFCENTPIDDISFGVNPAEFECQDSLIEFPSLFHLGAMNWIPNLQGVRWFINEVWPEVHRKYPKLKLYLAGTAMPKDLLKNQHPNIYVDGFIDDPKKYMALKAIMIVPLFSGSGIRIKIIEGMAAKKAIISTSQGASGIDCEDKKNILISDTKKEFIQAIETCVKDFNFVRQLGNNAKEFIAKNHNSDVLIRKLIRFYDEISSPKN